MIESSVAHFFTSLLQTVYFLAKTRISLILIVFLSHACRVSSQSSAQAATRKGVMAAYFWSTLAGN